MMPTSYQWSLNNKILIIDLVLFFKAEVYKAVAKPLIENVLTGYNATVFAYGATGIIIIIIIIIILLFFYYIIDCNLNKYRWVQMRVIKQGCGKNYYIKY